MDWLGPTNEKMMGFTFLQLPTPSKGRFKICDCLGLTTPKVAYPE